MRKILATAALLAGLALSSAVPAAATPGQDQRFWDILVANQMIPGPQAVNNAYMICSYLWSGRADVWDAVDAVYQDNDLTYRQAEIFVAAAVSIYCPPARGKNVA